MPSKSTFWITGGLATGIVLYWMVRKRIKTNHKLTKKELPEPKKEEQEIPELIEQVDSDTWAVAESENVMKLVVAISEDQVALDTNIHRSVSCNNCGTSPVR